MSYPLSHVDMYQLVESVFNSGETGYFISSCMKFVYSVFLPAQQVLVHMDVIVTVTVIG